MPPQGTPLYPRQDTPLPQPTSRETSNRGDLQKSTSLQLQGSCNLNNTSDSGKYIQINLNDIPYLGLIDSGADRSMNNSSVLEELSKTNALFNSSSHPDDLNSVDGSPYIFKGRYCFLALLPIKNFFMNLMYLTCQPMLF